MGTPADIKTFDRQHPVFGAFLNADVVRENVRALARWRRASADTATLPQLYADNEKFIAGQTLDLSTNYKTKITVDATIRTVDCRGASPAATTLAEVVSAINTSFGSTVAVAIDGYLWLFGATTGSSGLLKVEAAADHDATDAIFVFSQRGVSYPYTVNGNDPEDGEHYEDTASAATFNTKLAHRLSSAAHLDGAGVTFPIDLSERWNLKVRWDAASAVTVDCRTGGVSGPTVRTLADVVSAINAQTGVTLAYAVSGQLQLKSPTTGASSLVEVQSCNNNAAAAHLGLPTGRYPAENSYFPVQALGQAWNRNFFRYMEDVPGVGLWGHPLPGKSVLPSAGYLHGEVRWDIDAGVPWVWDAKKTGGAAWKRGVPGVRNHAQYDTSFEAFAVRYGVSVGDLPDLSDSYVRLAYVDDFNRSNAGSLGGNWAQSQSKFTISSNRAVFLQSAAGSAPANEDFCRYTAGGATANDMDVWASLSLASDDNSTEAWAGLIARSSGASSYYWVRVSNRGNGELYSWNGTSSTLVGSFTIDPYLGKTARVLRLRIVATAISVYWGGAAPTTLGHDVQPPTVTNTVNSPTDLNAARYEQDEAAFLAYSVTNGTISTGTGGGIYGKPGAAGVNVLVDNFGVRTKASTASHEVGLPAVSARRTRHSLTAARKIGGIWNTDPVLGDYIEDCRPDEFGTPFLFEESQNADGSGIEIIQTTGSKKLKWVLHLPPPPPINPDLCASIWQYAPNYTVPPTGGVPSGYNSAYKTWTATNFMVDPAFYLAYLPTYYSTYKTGYQVQHQAVKDWAISLYDQVGWTEPYFWQAWDVIVALAKKAIAGQPTTIVPQDPTVPGVPIPVMPPWEDVPTFLVPDAPFTPGTIVPPIYWNAPVATFGDLPTHANAKLHSSQVIPDGVVTLVIATNKSYRYRNATDDWVRVDDEAFGGSTVKDEGTNVRTDTTIFDFVGAGVSVADAGGGRVTITISGASVALGSSAGQAAEGNHVHGSGGYSLVPWAALSGVPSTFTPASHTLAGSSHTGQLGESRIDFDVSAGHRHNGTDSRRVAHADLSGIGANDHHNQVHALDGADHAGPLSANRVLLKPQFADATAYYLGKDAPTGVQLYVGHDGTSPLVTTFKIADHTHDPATPGSGGRIVQGALPIKTTYLYASGASLISGGSAATPAIPLGGTPAGGFVVVVEWLDGITNGGVAANSARVSKTASAFDVRLDLPVSSDVHFNWYAFATVQ